MQAWAIFTNDTDIRWLKVLRRGFRHCFVILNDGKNWIALDPLSSHLELTVPEATSDFDLPRFLQTQGCTVVRAKIKQQATQAPLSIFSCVETVKRVLGIRKRFIVTPWQLFKHLIKEHKRNRHCEERSDAAIQELNAQKSGLPRFARNDEKIFNSKKETIKWEA